MNRTTRGTIIPAALTTVLMLAGSGAMAKDGAKVGDKGQDLLAAKCGACHVQTPAGTLARIGEARKTPEGWTMTVHRMEKWHGLALTPAEERQVIKHLADRQGLAPDEAAPFRYVLERRPGVVETPDDADLATFCARCHSYARVGLQRRDAGDWTKLAHMHQGQWPTMEYQAMSRDRDWWKLVSTEVPKKLGEKWPLATPAWAEWGKRQPADLSGRWRVAGHQPGRGDYAGYLTAKRTGPDQYKLGYELAYADGGKLTGQGSSVVYTGYEWRGSVKLGGKAVDEVYAVSADGTALAGRWYQPDQDTIGGDLTAVRAGTPAILALRPSYLKAGTTATVTVVGSALAGTPDFGPGVTVEKTVSASADAVTVVLRADKGAAVGARAVAVGSTKAQAALTVYDKVDRVKVEPELMVARVGGNGGPVPPVPAQFEAVGYMNGPDGKPGTDDDVRIGVMPAKWRLGNFDQAAEKDRDAEFGGTLSQAGFFAPGLAGQNKARGGLNNFANLSVNALVVDAGSEIEGSSHLFVAPQRWVDAPIR